MYTHDSVSIGSIGPTFLRHALIGTLLLFLLSPAQAQQFGRTDPGTLATNGFSANFKRGSRFTLSEPGIVHTLCAYLDTNGGASGTQQVRMALYRDQNGVPSTEVVESSPLFLSAGEARTRCAGTGYVPIPPGNYWIVLHSSDPQGVVRAFYDGAANWYGGADTFSDGTSNTFGPGNAGTGTLTVSAQYLRQSEMKAAGRTSIGSTPSRGMTPNFKRGSSFELTEPGWLRGFTAYWDSPGAAANTSQLIGIALYHDANGVPGNKVAESDRTGLQIGNLPTWRSLRGVPPVLLDPGRYWIVLHTSEWIDLRTDQPAGGVGVGILRNYADGSGNWYGNADDFEDGAAETFGPGTPGNGTISALTLYQPGPFVTERIGRTDVGAIPSRGMTAHQVRGSQFSISRNDSAVVSAFYAYLDGNGGASGSQQLRMVMFSTDAPFGGVIGSSEIVSISAGTPPGWVRFPVTAFAFGGPIAIAIHSGDTGGVARNYGGDGGNNWFGLPQPDFFPDGAQELRETIGGTGTLSVYAEYTIRRP